VHFSYNAIYVSDIFLREFFLGLLMSY
jgi:hypothetical protein